VPFANLELFENIDLHPFNSSMWLSPACTCSPPSRRQPSSPEPPPVGEPRSSAPTQCPTSFGQGRNYPLLIGSFGRGCAEFGAIGFRSCHRQSSDRHCRKGSRLFWRLEDPSRPAGAGEHSAKTFPNSIRTMNRDSPLWGAPRIHRELLKLSIDIGKTSVGKYMVRLPQASLGRFFMVPTIHFQSTTCSWSSLTTAAGSCISMSPLIPPLSGPVSNRERASRLTKSPRYLLRDRDGSSALTSLGKSKLWGYRKCFQHLARPDSGPMWSA